MCLNYCIRSIQMPRVTVVVLSGFQERHTRLSWSHPMLPNPQISAMKGLAHHLSRPLPSAF